MYNDQSRDQLKSRITTLRNHYDTGKVTWQVLTSQVNKLESELKDRGPLIKMDQFEEALLLNLDTSHSERAGKHRK